MKIVFVTNIYKEEEKKEVARVSTEIKNLGFEDYEILVNDGIKDNRGYAYGVNQGIKKGLIKNIFGTSGHVKNKEKKNYR